MLLVLKKEIVSKSRFLCLQRMEQVQFCDILSNLLAGKYSPLEIHNLKCELGDRIFSCEDSLDHLTQIWRYINACFHAPLPAAVPQELNIFLLLYVLSVNEGFENYIKQDYLKQPGSSSEFFERYIELVLWVFTDYQNSDPVKHENWMVCYETLRRAWVTHTIPALEELKSVCTIAEKLTRKTQKRKAPGKGRGGKRARESKETVN